MSFDSSSSEEETLLLWHLATVSEKRKYWVHPINKQRKNEGEFQTLFPELLKDEDRFYVYFRMTIGSFNELFNLIKSEINKKDTNWRKTISPKERLAVFLRYIATGDSFKTIGHSYRIGFTTVGEIVRQVSKVIWKILQPIYMPVPTEQMWKQYETTFYEKWRFPNCIGCIDGKHIYIKCPPNPGSLYYCYKQKFSIVLLSIVDPDYKFIMIDVGSYGKESDSSIFQKTLFYQKISNNQLNIPQPKPLPGYNQPIPYVFIGDGGFRLETFLMRPFATHVAARDEKKRNYNQKLCSSRNVVESAFGHLVQKWAVFKRTFELDVDTVVDIVKAACCLYNYLKEKSDFLVNGNDNIEDLNQNAGSFQPFQRENTKSNMTSYAVREHFISFFN